MITHFLKYQFVYIFLFSGFIFLICSALVKNKTVKLTGFLFFSVFLALSLCEIIFYSPDFNFKFNKPDKFYNNPKINLAHIDLIREICLKDAGNKEYMYRYKNNENPAPKYYKKIYDVGYSVFEPGFRYTKGNENSDNIYIFLGCSFTFGGGLEDNETLPYYFSSSMNFKNGVLNFALAGKATNTVLNIFNHDIAASFIGQRNVKRFIYGLMQDHLYRNFNVSCYGANDNWIYKSGKWIRTKQPFGIFKIIFARSYIFQKIVDPKIEQYNKNFYEDYLLENFKEIDKIIIEKYNSKLTIIIWPDVFLNERLLKGLKELNIDIIILPEYFNSEEYKIKDNRHPNAKANKEIANILMKHLNNKNKI